MPGMLELAAFVDSLPERIRVATNECKKQAVLAIEQELTQATPIDTGAAISNWQVSIGAPADTPIAPHVPSRLGFTDLALHSRSQALRQLGEGHEHSVGLLGLSAGDGGAANAQVAMDLARQVVAEAAEGETIYIANVLPYIGRLNEDGISPQAMPGFVDVAIIAGRSAMDRAKFTP